MYIIQGIILRNFSDCPQGNLNVVLEFRLSKETWCEIREYLCSRKFPCCMVGDMQGYSIYACKVDGYTSRKC